MDDTEQNQHKFLKFQIMNPYPIHSMTQESPTHSLWLMAYPSMVGSRRSGPVPARAGPQQLSTGERERLSSSWVGARVQ